MAVQGSPEPAVVEINVTPMIDVLLVLIIVFFILSLPTKFVPVVIPPPQREVLGATHQVVLELPDGGGFLLNKQPVPDVELDQALHSAFDARPVKVLFVGAGPARSYAEVVEAMERARLDGAEVVAILPTE